MAGIKPGSADKKAVVIDEPPPVTPSTTTVSAADADIGEPGENQEDRLDEAIQESFPASDPVSTRIEGPDYDPATGKNPP
jgi:hypothetical protein